MDVLAAHPVAMAEHSQGALACGIGPADLLDVGLAEFTIRRVRHGFSFQVERLRPVT